MTLQDRPHAHAAGDAPSADREPASTALGAHILPRVVARRLTRGGWRVSYFAKSGNEHVIGRYKNHATAQHQARAYAKVHDCPVEEAGA